MSRAGAVRAAPRYTDSALDVGPLLQEIQIRVFAFLKQIEFARLDVHIIVLRINQRASTRGIFFITTLSTAGPEARRGRRRKSLYQQMPGSSPDTKCGYNWCC